ALRESFALRVSGIRTIASSPSYPRKTSSTPRQLLRNMMQDLRGMAVELQMNTVMPESLFEELKRYVGFGAADEQALRMLHPVAKPHFERVSEVFYQRILQHEAARKALTEGESMVGRLRHTLVEWMDQLLTGPRSEEHTS